MVGLLAMVVLGASPRSAVGEDRRAPAPAKTPATTKAPAKRAKARQAAGPAASTVRPCFEVHAGTQEARCFRTLPEACRAAGCAIGEPAIHPCGVYTSGRLILPRSPEAEGLRAGEVVCFGW